MEGIEDGGRAIVQAYNQDDCFSARALRDWLEDLRSGLRYLPATQEGNQNSSPEEALAVAELVQNILKSNAS